MDYDEIIPGLILGSSRYDEAALKELNVTAVVNMTPSDEVPTKIRDVHELTSGDSDEDGGREGGESAGMKFYRFPVSYRIPAEVSHMNFLTAIATVKTLVANGETVYLHCFEGVNRSACVAIGVVARLQNISINQAHALVASKRRIMPQYKYLVWLG